LATEIGFPGARQTANDNKGWLGYWLGKLPQALNQPLHIGNKLGMFHTPDYKMFPFIWLGGN